MHAFVDAGTRTLRTRSRSPSSSLASGSKRALSLAESPATAGARLPSAGSSSTASCCSCCTAPCSCCRCTRSRPRPLSSPAPSTSCSLRGSAASARTSCRSSKPPSRKSRCARPSDQLRALHACTVHGVASHGAASAAHDSVAEYTRGECSGRAQSGPVRALASRPSCVDSHASRAFVSEGHAEWRRLRFCSHCCMHAHRCVEPMVVCQHRLGSGTAGHDLP